MESDDANTPISPSTVKGDSAPAPLPPSVEAAYKKKCIQLKQRLNELETENAAKRIRIDRNKRFVEKMRLEQAILLEHLGKIQQKKGLTPEGLPLYDFPDEDPDSEGSSEGPPTVRIFQSIPHRTKSPKPDQQQPNEKPLRSKRSHRRPMPSPPSGPGPAHSTPIQEHQPYLTQMGDYERNTRLPTDSLTNYEAVFNPAPYQPPQVAYNSKHLPGEFRDHNPNPLTAFHTWVQHCRATNPAYADLDDSESVDKARDAWQRLFSEKDMARMKAEYDERVEDWYARQEEWEMAEVRMIFFFALSLSLEVYLISSLHPIRGGAESSR